MATTPSSVTPRTGSAPAPAGGLGRTVDVFIGRQPIFDRQKEVFGYELLYRAGHENAYRHDDGNQATSRVVHNSMNVVGLAELTGQRKAFVNVPRDLLLNQFYTVLPRDRAVVELLETVAPDADVIAACRELKDQGYLLALDDFVAQPRYEPLVELADFIKIDFLATRQDERRRLAGRFAGQRVRLLAEKVESPADVEEGMALGYAFFQGYFFCKPQIVVGKDVPPFKRNYLRFLYEVHRPQIDFSGLERVIKEEVSLSYKLLRYLNSAAFGLRHEVHSIRDALTLLGEKPVKKWASVVAAAGMGEDKPAELAVTCLVRARFCELLAPHVGLADRELDLFLLGLLSAADALVDQPMSEVLGQITVAQDVKATLLGAASALGPIYTLALCCERGNWTFASSLAARWGLSETRVADLHRQAIVWADEIFSMA